MNDPLGKDRIEWHGEMGSITAGGYALEHARLQLPAQEMVDACEEEFPELDPEWSPVEVHRSDSEWFDMILDSHRDFVASVRDGVPSSCDALEATRVVEFANAAYFSAVVGSPVDVSTAVADYAGVYRRLCDGSAIISETGARP